MRATRLEVDLDVVGANLAALDSAVGDAQVMPVIKAEAYGHGLVEVGRHLEAVGARRLAVAIVDEGVRLRRAGVSLPVLVMGAPDPAQLGLYLDHDLEVTVPGLALLERVDEAARHHRSQLGVHLKVDTGMGRLGVRAEESAPLIEAALRAPGIRLEGFFSHLANSDRGDLAHARGQLERFVAAAAHFERLGEPMPLRHLSNSGAVLRLPEAHLDLVRPGIALFGVAPAPEVELGVAVRPAMRWVSRPSFVKEVRPGEALSYGSTWTADRTSRIATLPVGYADGYRLANSNRAQVLVEGCRRAVRGRVCMDQTMIEWGSSPAEAEVVLLGAQGDEEIDAHELAGWGDTIAYEVMTSIGVRVPRLYRGGSAPGTSATRAAGERRTGE